MCLSYRPHSIVERLVLGFAEFVCEVNLAGGNEAVNEWLFRAFQCPQRSLHISRHRPRQRRHLHFRKLPPYGLHGFEIPVGSYRETGLEDVDT